MTRKITAVIIGLSLFLTASCALGPFMADMLSPDTSSVLSVNTTGAKAVAGTESQSRSGSRAVDDRALEDNPVLVKFLENGTIASVIESETGGSVPPVAFITTGDDGSIYVGFDYMWWIWTGTGSSGIQFIRIYPESTRYDVLWPPADTDDINAVGNISVWGWWGMEQDPLVKGPDGSLYFKVEKWTSNSAENHIYKYDPSVGGDPLKVTPDNSTLSISTFMVDAEQHLFFQSEGWDGNASYLRYYTGNQTGYRTVYYSSDQDTWIRGYTTSPNGDFLVINGQNIRGMNGIIKVSNLDYALPETAPAYQLMYGDANNGNWIRLYKYYADSWVNNTELIDQKADLSFEWRDDVKTAGVVDINKIYTKIQPFFYNEPAVISGKEVFVTGLLDGTDSGRSLRSWITDYPEDFLRTYFTGDLFKDWLSDNNMTDLYFSNIGTMLWASDGSLYGLYDSGWWGMDSGGTKIVKLLDSNGDRDLSVVDLDHGDEEPSMIKIEGDYLYYRYAVLDSYGEESGLHQLSRLNITTGHEIEILPTELNDSIEIVSYDVSSSNEQVYFVGANPQTNEIINGKIDISAGTWSKIDTTLRFGNIRVIE